jgi:hypothetical protein
MANNAINHASTWKKVSTIGEAVNLPWTAITAIISDQTQLKMPLTPAEFARFEAGLSFFNIDTEAEACPGRQITGAFTGARVETPFLALGAFITFIAEGRQLALPGALIAEPDAGADTPCFDGCVPAGGLTGDAAARNAALDWGGPGQVFGENFVQAYRLQIRMGRRIVVVDELASHVGVWPRPNMYGGAGCSLAPAMKYIEATNSVLHDKGYDRLFIPQNVVVGDAGTECIGAPTAGNTYGHFTGTGLSQKMYCFQRPLLYVPTTTIRIGLSRVEQDCCFLEAMRREGVLDLEVVPTPAPGVLGETLACGAGFSSAYTIPGGCFSFGVGLFGVELFPSACIDYLNYVYPDSLQFQMLLESSFMQGLLQQQALKGTKHLAGLSDQGKKNLQLLMENRKATVNADE